MAASILISSSVVSQCVIQGRVIPASLDHAVDAGRDEIGVAE